MAKDVSEAAVAVAEKALASAKQAFLDSPVMQGDDLYKSENAIVLEALDAVIAARVVVVLTKAGLL